MPIRSCIICRAKQEKNILTRIVSDMDGNAILDEKQSINSRGIYMCKNEKCLINLAKMIEKNKFKTKIGINNESLLKIIKGNTELGE